MENEKHYYTELHADGFKYTNKFSGFDSACAHFSTESEPYTPSWVVAQCKAIDLIGGQQTLRIMEPPQSGRFGFRKRFIINHNVTLVVN